jgi:hypothetical protein
MDREWTLFEIRLGLLLLAGETVWLGLLWWCAESLVGWAVAP